MLSKWKQVDDTPLVSSVAVDLLTSLESLDHIAIRCKDNLSLDCQTLQRLRLMDT